MSVGLTGSLIATSWDQEYGVCGRRSLHSYRRLFIVWIHFVVTLGCRSQQAFEIKQFWIDSRANVYKLISFESLNLSDGTTARDLRFAAFQIEFGYIYIQSFSDARIDSFLCVELCESGNPFDATGSFTQVMDGRVRLIGYRTQPSQPLVKSRNVHEPLEYFHWLGLF